MCYYQRRVRKIMMAELSIVIPLGISLCLGLDRNCKLNIVNPINLSLSLA